MKSWAWLCLAYLPAAFAAKLFAGHNSIRDSVLRALHLVPNVTEPHQTALLSLPGLQSLKGLDSARDALISALRSPHASEKATSVCGCESPGHWSTPDCRAGTICKCYGEARFGYGKKWTSWRKVDKEIQCSETAFGTDPYAGRVKICQCNQVKQELGPVVEALQSVIKTFKPMIVRQKEIVDAVLSKAYADLLRCNQYFLKKLEGINKAEQNINKMNEAHRTCRGQQLEAVEFLENCEGNMPEMKRKAEEKCAYFERKFKSLPTPENVWALQCDARPEGRTVHEYLMEEFEFWDTLGRKYDQAEAECTTAWKTADNVTKHCLGHANIREERQKKCDALQDKMEDFACKQSLIDKSACMEYNSCYAVNSGHWEKIKRISCGPEGQVAHFHAQMRLVLILECILFAVENDDSAAVEKCGDHDYDLSKFGLNISVCDSDLVDEVKTEQCSYIDIPDADPQLPGTAKFEEGFYRGILYKTSPKECVATCCMKELDCPVHSHHFEVGLGCQCNPGYRNGVDSLSTPNCLPVPCPASSFGHNVPTGCKCKLGFYGFIKASSEFPFYDGHCEVDSEYHAHKNAQLDEVFG